LEKKKKKESNYKFAKEINKEKKEKKNASINNLEIIILFVVLL